MDVRRTVSASATAAAARIIANKGVSQVVLRQKDKFVPLLIDGDEPSTDEQAAASWPPALDPAGLVLETAPAHTIFEDLPSLVVNDSTRGRITLYCTAESYDRKRLEASLKSSFHPTSVMSYPDVFYLVGSCAAAHGVMVP
jgi:uncharacterized Rmd1/YagE family protein